MIKTPKYGVQHALSMAVSMVQAMGLMHLNNMPSYYSIIYYSVENNNYLVDVCV